MMSRMQLLGIRTAGGDWSWCLRGPDGATVVQRTRTFSSYALCMTDASCVCDHLQTAEIDGADDLPMLPMRGGPRDR